MDDDRRVFDVIDSKPRKRRLGLITGVAIVLALLLFGSQLLNIYIDALWFSAVGYSKVYWYKFRLGGLLFLTFFILSFVIARVPFFFLNKALPELRERPKFRISSVEDFRELNFLPLIYRPGVWVLAAAIALLSAISMSQEWPQFALYLHSQPAEVSDPIFGRDVSFYLFKLPVIELVAGWLQTISVVMLIAIGAVSGYVWYFEKVKGTLTSEIRRRATSAISLAAGFFALMLAVGTYLDRFDLLHGQHELFTGIDYTDANVRLMGLNVVVGLLLLAAIIAVINAFVMKRLRPIVALAAIVAVVWVLGVGIIPGTFHSFSVKPNELAKEAAFIEHNIKATRSAFAIDRFEERPFEPKPNFTPQQLQANRETLDNVRLWDRRALQSTLSQIQEIRTYYDFRLPDVDRYMLNGRLREVMLSARELNVDQLPEQSRNWINQHVVYTHGYGVTMNTVNEFTPEGLPNLVLRNMPIESSAPEIKVTRPELYYGEESNSHVYVHTKPQGATPPEFNYPAPGNVDSYTTYESDAGIQVGGLMRQLALSLYLGDGTNLLFSDYINSASRVLIRRNVSERVRQIAPFLLFDDDPYLVIGSEGKLFWIIDAFTYSEQYPYSTAYPIADRTVNYIRNSVKAVIDAYDGSVNFYVFEPDDPMIRAYQDIFPDLFRAKSEMPADLLAHIRYPSLLVSAQARVYTLYHMQNTQTFYNHEDLWNIAAEQASQQGAEAQAMQPYHVLMQLPGEQNPALEFVDILPFTPSGPGRSNMIGWLAARSDAAHYGHTLVYSFPKNVTVNGPAQIRARVNQDPTLSQQMTLWNQQGSELLRGNLLVIPIADSLLYLEPFYLQASGSTSKLPELRQVAVATQDQLKAAKTFEEALALLFPGFASRPATTPGQGMAAGQNAGAQQSALGGQMASKQPAANQPNATGSSSEVEQLARQAQQLLTDYERLTAEGKHREAGEKLDQLKQTLDQLNRKRGG